MLFKNNAIQIEIDRKLTVWMTDTQQKGLVSNTSWLALYLVNTAWSSESELVKVVGACFARAQKTIVSPFTVLRGKDWLTDELGMRKGITILTGGLAGIGSVRLTSWDPRTPKRWLKTIEYISQCSSHWRSWIWDHSPAIPEPKDASRWGNARFKGWTRDNTETEGTLYWQ